MSYHQTFKGHFTYPDDAHLEAAIDAFVAELARLAKQERSIVELEELTFDGLTVRVDQKGSAPASMYESTIIALETLGLQASSGCIDTTFHLDGVSRQAVYPGLEGVDPEGPRHRRWEVFAAARAGDASRLRALAATGVSLAQVYEGHPLWSSLHLAAAQGSADAVAFLLQSGVAPDLRCDGGTPPLWVAKTGEIARLLLAAGAELDLLVGGSQAIVQAASYGRHDVVMVLLEAGAQIPASAHEAMARACARHGQLATLHALVAHDPTMAAVLAAPRVISDAVYGRNPVLVDFLLDHGAVMPDSFFEDAIAAKATALVETLMQRTDALARCGSSSQSKDAMCRAAAAGSLEIMQLLARAGVPIHPVEPFESSPLACAAGGSKPGALACVKWLIEQGVSVTSTNERGRTPLQSAWWSGPEMQVLLVEHGADPSQLTPDEMAAEDYAAFRSLLEERGLG